MKISPSQVAFTLGSSIAGLALMGFIPQTRRQESGGEESILGAIPTNRSFDFLRLGLGAWGVLASRNDSHARTYLTLLGGSYAIMALMGALPNEKTRTAFGTLPLHGGNVWLHAATAAGAAASVAMDAGSKAVAEA